MQYRRDVEDIMKGMQNRREAGQDVCRERCKQDRMQRTGEICRKGQRQDRNDDSIVGEEGYGQKGAGQEGCRTGEIQDMRVQDRKDA